jgi:hypothetical protein
LVSAKRVLAGERNVADARATQTLDFFYDALDPYGDWIEIERYGFAFRPKLARDLRWRPYTDGGWIYTDYGWTWRSDEPFGWATYHYGRWTRVPRLGWVWIPGTEWGPAWVSWRRSDDYVGWAALPPDAWSATGFNAAVDSYFDIGPGSYVFVGIRDFAEPTYTGRVVESEQNVTIINKTVNVTNVTYKTVNQQNVVVNNGPEIAFVEQRGGRPVQRARVERLAMAKADDAQPAKLQGNVLRLAAPHLNANTTAAKPKAVKEQVKAEETDRGWEKSNAEAKRSFREQTQREARRAERVERGESDTDAPAAAAPVRGEPAAPAPKPVPPRQPTPQPPMATPRVPGRVRERPERPSAPPSVPLANDAPLPAPPVTTGVSSATPRLPEKKHESSSPAPSTPARPRRGVSAIPQEDSSTPTPAALIDLLPLRQ